MPLALLLSPDDQAVSAITAVLEEMAVTCERPLDGASAAKQLNSQSFDLVLVDCENLPAAKLIFDVCRRGKSGHNPVPIAIVDGRAGLPTAFRLGAELILTKPVAKDQARNTIRNAVSRVKKEEPARNVQLASMDAGQNEAVQASPSDASSSQASTDPTEALLTQYEVPSEPVVKTTSEPKAAAAAAAAGSSSVSLLSQFSSAAPSPTISAAPLPAPSPKPKASFATPAFDELPAENVMPPITSARAPAATAAPKPAPVAKPSDDPVLAELEKGDTPPPAPIFSAYPPKQRKARGSLVALLAVALVGGGFYAAWIYQPGFRAAVQPQIEAVVAYADNLLQAQSSVSSPNRGKPAVQSQPVPAAATVAGSSPASQPADASAATSTPVATPSAAPTSANPASATAASAAPAVQPVSPANEATGAIVGGTTTVGADKKGVHPSANPNVSTSNTAAAPLASDELPGEKTAIILSSKGAEKRLVRSVHSTYPAEARSTGSEGTVVLKTVIDESGRVVGARVVEGDAALAKAAISAVKQWRYRPYVRDGKTLPFQTIVVVDFQRP